MCVFCIFAQGFSVKAQRFDQKSKFLTSFITFLDLKMLKTFVLDTFADENTIKPLDFQLVARECRYTWMMHSWGGGDRSKQVI